MIVVLHAIIIALVYASPFLFGWKVILILIVAYYLQLLFLGNCLLTIWQFGERSRDSTFYSYLLEKFGINADKRRVRIVVDYFIPWLILAVALIWQVMLRGPVLLM